MANAMVSPMDDKERCSCSSSDVRVVACSGACNVGQIANQAAVNLSNGGIAGFFCLAAVAAHIEAMVKAAREAELMISIDGCPMRCAARTLQHLQIDPAIQIIVTELGIEKTQELAIDRAICSRVVERVKEKLHESWGQTG